MLRYSYRAAFAAAAMLVAAAAGAQTVDDIVAKNLEAKGGAEKWKAVNTVKMTGRITLQGKELPLTVYAKRPNLNRQEISVQDRKVVQAFDGTTAWAINPMMGGEEPRELPGPVAETVRFSADFDGALIDYKAKGHTVELVGKEKVDGKEAYHLKVTLKGGDVQQHYYLDADTGLELRTSTDVDLGTGQKQPLVTEMSDYKQVDGITIPHTIRQLLDGKPVVQMTIDKVEFNAPIDDGLFSMPKK